MNWDTPVIKDNGFINTSSLDFENTTAVTSKTFVPEEQQTTIVVNGTINPLITENRFENINTPVSFYHWKNSGYGKDYDPIYNELDSSYATALTKNYLVNVTNHYYEFYPIFNDYDEDTLELYAIDAYDE